VSPFPNDNGHAESGRTILAGFIEVKPQWSAAMRPKVAENRAFHEAP